MISAGRLLPDDVAEIRDNYFHLRRHLPIPPRPAKRLVELDEYFTPPKVASMSMGLADFTKRAKFKSESCYVPRLDAIELTSICLLDSERTPCVVVPFGYRSKGELLTTPTPQPPPAPLVNAELYDHVSAPFEELKKIINVQKIPHDFIKGAKQSFSFGTEYFVCDSKILIPSVLFKSAAKSEKGIASFRERREDAFLLRRVEYGIWEAMLQEEGFKNRVSHDALGCVDKRDFCKQCRSTFFRRVKGKLRCYDCHWMMGEWASGDSKGLETYMECLFGDGSGSGISLDGTWGTETTKEVPSREKWMEVPRSFFNPSNKKYGELSKEDLEEIKDDKQFQTLLADYQTTFYGDRVKELADAAGVKPNTFTKRISNLELKRMFHNVWGFR